MKSSTFWLRRTAVIMCLLVTKLVTLMQVIVCVFHYSNGVVDLPVPGNRYM